MAASLREVLSTDFETLSFSCSAHHAFTSALTSVLAPNQRMIFSIKSRIGTTRVRNGLNLLSIPRDGNAISNGSPVDTSLNRAENDASVSVGH